jgi:hypothetical protein
MRFSTSPVILTPALRRAVLRGLPRARLDNTLLITTGPTPRPISTVVRASRKPGVRMQSAALSGSSRQWSAKTSVGSARR